MLKYKQIWHGIKPTKWLIKFNLTVMTEIGAKCKAPSYVIKSYVRSYMHTSIIEMGHMI